MTASLIASLLLRCKRRVPVAPSVLSLRSSHDGVAHCSCVAYRVCLWHHRSLRFARHMTASLIASLLLRCLPHVPDAPSVPCFARHVTASLVTSLLLRCTPHMPFAPSVPSLRSSHDGVAHCVASLASLTAPLVPLLRSSHDGVAHCFASLALQTVCACGAAVLMLAIPERTVTPPHADGQSSSDFISNAMTAVMES